jgi:hypothetical protein
VIGVGDFVRIPRERAKKILYITLSVTVSYLLLSQVLYVKAGKIAQIPTVSIPTVTGTPLGAIAIVLTSEVGFANVRSGPSTMGYDVIGVMVVGQQVPALGRTSGGDWIKIAYPGVPGGVAWIWSDLVDVSGSLPIVEAPPTPTPRVTPTIDPTLAAQFLVEIPPTRLPTYTAPPPLIIPTLPADEPVSNTAGVPMGFIIIGLAVVGLFGTFISFLGGR